MGGKTDSNQGEPLGKGSYLCTKSKAIHDDLFGRWPLQPFQPDQCKCHPAGNRRTKNWLFCDFTDGADASMAVYTLLETARANGLNPLKYLEFLLNARPNERGSIPIK